MKIGAAAYCYPLVYLLLVRHRIIAPLAVMEQWALEVRTKTQPGRLKVTTHHGPQRTKCECGSVMTRSGGT